LSSSRTSTARTSGEEQQQQFNAAAVAADEELLEDGGSDWMGHADGAAEVDKGGDIARDGGGYSANDDSSDRTENEIGKLIDDVDGDRAGYKIRCHVDVMGGACVGEDIINLSINELVDCVRKDGNDRAANEGDNNAGMRGEVCTKRSGSVRIGL